VRIVDAFDIDKCVIQEIQLDDQDFRARHGLRAPGVGNTGILF
jgi:hypothetical protein